MLPLNVKNMISVEDLVLQATPFAEYGRIHRRLDTVELY